MALKNGLGDMLFSESWICFIKKVRKNIPQKVPKCKAQGLKNHQKGKTRSQCFDVFFLFFSWPYFLGFCRNLLLGPVGVMLGRGLKPYRWTLQKHRYENALPGTVYGPLQKGKSRTNL